MSAIRKKGIVLNIKYFFVNVFGNLDTTMGKKYFGKKDNKKILKIPIIGEVIPDQKLGNKIIFYKKRKTLN